MPETYIARSSAIAAREIGGEMMIMSAVNSTLFTLNPVATMIWQSADGQTPLSRIVDERVCAAFDVDRETATRDAQAFIAELEPHGIILVSNSPIDQAGTGAQ